MLLHPKVLIGVTLAVACAGGASAASLGARQPAILNTGAATFADDARDRIVEAVQRKYGARAVRVTEIVVAGRRAFELRLLSEQRVWTVRVDAESGQELPDAD
jgi:hypothetical protein